MKNAHVIFGTGMHFERR